MVEKFMKRYFPPIENTKRIRDIANFEQKDREFLSDAWNRFKQLIKNCSHNGVLECVQMEIFYDGLNKSSQQAVDAAEVGMKGLMDKTYIKTKNILEGISRNH